MEKLKNMKECLIGIVESQIYGNLDKVDAKELGEAIDMIKDLSEAIYYCTIADAMEEDDWKKEPSHHEVMYYAPKKMMPDHSSYKDHYNYDRAENMMKYPKEHGMKDPREGRSGERRKMYMEGKMVNDRTAQMRELENYMQELSSDLFDMIQDASAEEKQLLQQKISTLATKIK